jgi:hypothetical protein
MNVGFGSHVGCDISEYDAATYEEPDWPAFIKVVFEVVELGATVDWARILLRKFCNEPSTSPSIFFSTIEENDDCAEELSAYGKYIANSLFKFLGSKVVISLNF